MNQSFQYLYLRSFFLSPPFYLTFQQFVVVLQLPTINLFGHGLCRYQIYMFSIPTFSFFLIHPITFQLYFLFIKLVDYFVFNSMGGNQSQTQRIKQRHQKFLKVFRNNYQLKEEQNDQIFGSITLYFNKNTGSVEIMEKCLALQSQEDIDKILRTMEKRVSRPTPNLLRIYSIEHNEDHELCGTSKYVKIYTQYLHKNLKNQLRKRRKTGSFLSQQLLLKISVSLLNGIKYLHDENVFHGEIRTQNILVDGSFHLKLTQRSLLCPSNWEVDLKNGTNLKILKGKGVLLSPCILDCVENQRTQLVEYNPFKADIFALGMILLECCSLKKAEGFYDYEGVRVKLKQISMTLYECRKKYSANLMNIIDKMLETQDENRPSATELMSKMEKISGDTIREMNTTLNESFMSESIRSYM